MKLRRDKRLQRLSTNKAIVTKARICMNCKRWTKFGHFVPPSLGEEGFWTCEAEQ